MAETVAFLQVSDTHVFADESGLREFNPARNVRRVVEKIGTLPIAPQFCLITGDLAQDGAVASYEHLRRLLQPIAARGVPFLPAVGNHDNRAALRRGFLGEEGENGERLHYVRTFGGLRVIVLDSLIPGEDEGRLGEEQLAWLAEQLEESAPLGTILALHHSPTVTGLSGVGRWQLRDAEALRGVDRGSAVAGDFGGALPHGERGLLRGDDCIDGTGGGFSTRAGSERDGFCGGEWVQPLHRARWRVGGESGDGVRGRPHPRRVTPPPPLRRRPLP